jgi:hypothetical protein
MGTGCRPIERLQEGYREGAGCGVKRERERERDKALFRAHLRASSSC